MNNTRATIAAAAATLVLAIAAYGLAGPIAIDGRNNDFSASSVDEYGDVSPTAYPNVDVGTYSYSANKFFKLSSTREEREALRAAIRGLPVLNEYMSFHWFFQCAAPPFAAEATRVSLYFDVAGDGDGGALDTPWGGSYRPNVRVDIVGSDGAISDVGVYHWSENEWAATPGLARLVEVAMSDRAVEGLLPWVVIGNPAGPLVQGVLVIDYRFEVARGRSRDLVIAEDDGIRLGTAVLRTGWGAVKGPRE